MSSPDELPRRYFNFHKWLEQPVDYWGKTNRQLVWTVRDMNAAATYIKEQAEMLQHRAQSPATPNYMQILQLDFTLYRDDIDTCMNLLKSRSFVLDPKESKPGGY